MDLSVPRERTGSSSIAWGEVYERVRPSLVRALAVAAGSYEGVEDAIQEAFADAMTKAPPELRSAEGWLYTAALNRLRRQHWRAGVLRTLRIAGPPPMNDLDQALLRTDLTRALLALPIRDRELLVAKHYIGMTQEEIAAYMKLPRGTVSAALSRAANRLREEEGRR